MDFGREDYNKYLNNIFNSDGSERELPFDDGEPVFLIRGCDPIGTQLLIEYAKQLLLSETSSDVAKSAFNHAIKMREWQKTHGTKNADLMRIPEGTVLDTSRINQIIEAIEVDGKISQKVFDELTDLFDKIYGPNKLRVCMSNELRVITSSPGFEPIKDSDALLTLGVIDNKIIILSSRL
jgi:hypothetical protein